MFIRTISKHHLQKPAMALLFAATAALLLYRPAAMATGISRGLSICCTVIIPTLYPFMLLAGWLANSPLCRQPGRLTTRLTERLFGLPGCCGPAILLSLIGGYPAGALAIRQLKEQGLLTHAQARRMLPYCMSGGPGFIISTVGVGLLQNTLAGILLFAAHTTASLAIGLWLGRGHRRAAPAPVPSSLSAPARGAAQVVSDTCHALLNMCGFVILAAAILSVSEAIALPRLLQTLSTLPATGWSAALAALLEVSCGCIALAGSGALAPFWLSLCMSWGGLSIHGQLAAALPEQPVLCPSFWKWRLLHGGISGCLSLLLFRLFPAAAPTLNGQINSGAVRPYSVSFTVSILLLMMSFLAMLCFSEKKAGKNETHVV